MTNKDMSEIKENYIYTIMGRSIIIEKYIGKSQIVQIPETIECKPVLPNCQ